MGAVKWAAVVIGARDDGKRERLQFYACTGCGCLVAPEVQHVCAATMAVNVAVADYRQAAPRQAVDVLEAARAVVDVWRRSGPDGSMASAVQRLATVLDRLDS